jgi:hypothetical protein
MVATIDGQRIVVHGSAVMVAAGVALCALHVVERYTAGIAAGSTSIVCIAPRRHGADLWLVRHVTNGVGSDFAFLAVEAISTVAPDHMYRVAALTTRTPRVGERLLCLGFVAAQESFERQADGTRAFSGQLIAAAGSVTEVHPLGRDSRLLPFPALEVDFPAWGGMSGGPVFDERGYLVGILSRSWETEDEPSPSYVALAWAALASIFRQDWPLPAARNLALLDVATCSIQRPEAIVRSAGGKVDYRIWYE